MICKPRSLSDIESCVKIYEALNDFSFIRMSTKASIQNISQFVRRNKFMRMKVVDNEIVAWILCEKSKPYHQEEFQFQQTYYASKRSGLQAYRDVLDLHNAMIEEARLQNIPVVVSLGSHMDSENTFARILEKNGWERRGYAALKRLD